MLQLRGRAVCRLRGLSGTQPPTQLRPQAAALFATASKKARLHGRLPETPPPRRASSRKPRRGAEAAEEPVPEAAAKARPTSSAAAAPSSAAAAREAEARRAPEELLPALEGGWEDDLGVAIRIAEGRAQFSDQPEDTFGFRVDGGKIYLRGAKLDAEDLSKALDAVEERAPQPIWLHAHGITRRWHRPSQRPDDELWRTNFYQYKGDRLLLRRQLYAAIAAQDLTMEEAFRAAWLEGGYPPEADASIQERLALGRNLVPGICFQHRKFGYRGVVIACEPWCTAPDAWKEQMGVRHLERGDRQPFYHCIVDERDRPGSQVTFVGEENVELSAQGFPVRSPLAELLLDRCDALGGYIPKDRLEKALRSQRVLHLPFDLESL